MSASWGDTVLSLYYQKKFLVDIQTAPRMVEKPFLHNANPAAIVASILQHDVLAAAWILVTQVSVDEYGCDAVWHKATFRIQVWLLERNAEAPKLLLEEFTTRINPGHPVNLTKLVSDIDRVAIERETIFVRDKRLITESQLSLCAAWRKFLRVESPVLAECV